MKAILHHSYGPPDVLALARVDDPEIEKGDILVRVRAASVNPYDWHLMTGKPYLVRLVAGLRRPRHPVRGVDVAGVVEAAGDGVSSFRPGDRVFGCAEGSFAELATSPEKRLVRMPDELGFEEAAALPVAALTALQALRDHGETKAGHSVLINGAAGGVGTYAVQIAKAMGAEVTGVTSTRNLELVESLGANHVVDYTSEDFADSERRYDVIIDNVANRTLSDLRSVLGPQGTIVMVTIDKSQQWLGPLLQPLAAKLRTLGSRQRVTSFTAQINHDDLSELARMTTSGELRSVIDRVYPLQEAAEAVRYLGKGHARGKVVVRVGS